MVLNGSRDHRSNSKRVANVTVAVVVAVVACASDCEVVVVVV